MDKRPHARFKAPPNHLCKMLNNLFKFCQHACSKTSFHRHFRSREFADSSRLIAISLITKVEDESRVQIVCLDLNNINFFLRFIMRYFFAVNHSYLHSQDIGLSSDRYHEHLQQNMSLASVVCKYVTSYIGLSAL